MRALVIDADPGVREHTREVLEERRFAVSSSATVDDGIELARQERVDLALIGLRRGDPPGLAGVRAVLRAHPELLVAVAAAEPDVDLAVAAMRAGAVHCLGQPLSPQDAEVLLALARCPPEGAPAARDRGAWLHLLRAATAAVRRRDLPAADRLARRALAARPGEPHAYLLLGALAELGGDPVSGQPFYRAALDLDPTYGPARANLERASRPPVWGPPTLDPALEEP